MSPPRHAGVLLPPKKKHNGQTINNNGFQAEETHNQGEEPSNASLQVTAETDLRSEPTSILFCPNDKSQWRYDVCYPTLASRIPMWMLRASPAATGLWKPQYQVQVWK